VIQSTQIQEFVAETPERQALMTTKSKEISTRRYLQLTKRVVWYGKYYPAPDAPEKRVQLGRTSETRSEHGSLDDIVAVLNRNPQHVLGVEPVRRFVDQVYIPQKYENGDWRKGTGPEAEYLFRRSVLPDIGELRCRDLRTSPRRAA
jgi:hypothetical protein